MPLALIATAFVLLMTKNVPKEKVCHFVIFGRLYYVLCMMLDVRCWMFRDYVRS